jgi:hypothetical protein
MEEKDLNALKVMESLGDPGLEVAPAPLPVDDDGEEAAKAEELDIVPAATIRDVSEAVLEAPAAETEEDKEPDVVPAATEETVMDETTAEAENDEEPHEEPTATEETIRDVPEAVLEALAAEAEKYKEPDVVAPAIEEKTIVETTASAMTNAISSKLSDVAQVCGATTSIRRVLCTPTDQTVDQDVMQVKRLGKRDSSLMDNVEEDDDDDTLDEIIEDSNLADPNRHITIVTTAALPWLTGTAVNPLLRALYLTRGRPKHHVTLMIPWLNNVKSRSKLYGKDRPFTCPQEQEEWIRNFCRERAHCAGMSFSVL